MLHTIEFTGSSEQMHSEIIVTINEERKALMRFKGNNISHTINFMHEYPENGLNTITIHFDTDPGNEPADGNKQLILHRITINDQKIRPDMGDYNPYINDSFPHQKNWIKEHENDEQYLDWITRHGGVMGWYGTMEYDYNIRDTLGTNLVQSLGVRYLVGRRCPIAILRDPQTQRWYDLNG